MEASTSEPRSPIDQATLERLRLRLEHERHRLAIGLKQLGRPPEVHDGGDPGDDADNAVRFAPPDVEERLHQQYEETLRAVEAAIRRMEEGSYGINPETGELIPVERLEAMPWAVR